MFWSLVFLALLLLTVASLCRNESLQLHAVTVLGGALENSLGPELAPIHPRVLPTTPRNDRHKRQYVSPLVKKKVAADQKWRCAMCKKLLDETYEIDHIIPIFKGGNNDPKHNLQALCRSCHMEKSATEK